jgi:hypothetical protein
MAAAAAAARPFASGFLNSTLRPGLAGGRGLTGIQVGASESVRGSDRDGPYAGPLSESSEYSSCTCDVPIPPARAILLIMNCLLPIPAIDVHGPWAPAGL